MAITASVFRRGSAAICSLIVTAPLLLAQAQPPLFELTTYPVPSVNYLSDVDVADVDGDGVVDIGVLVHPNGYRVLLGRGDGSFFPLLDSPLGVVSKVWKATLADIDGDALADRLLVGESFNVYVQLSLGDGQFVASGVYPIGCVPWELHVVDLNGDSWLDLAASFGEDPFCWEGITTYLGEPQGLFGNKFTQFVTVQVDMTALAPADLDGDGDLDLAGASSGGTLCRFMGAGDGTVGPTIPFPTSGWSADCADVDADGWPDVVSMGWTDVQVYRGTGQEAFAPVIVSPEPPAQFNTTSQDPHLALGDFNADGHIDAAGAKDGQLLISLGTGSGAFEPATALFPELVVWWLRAADVDGDGSTDLVLGCSGAVDEVGVLLNLRPAWPWATVQPG
ncbi:MAG TPA: VCBS repeat-containing protein, partial [Planctomycetota bacterium]|nr:VCBS repeat-containing protein [Planctomycetota bacterium]